MMSPSRCRSLPVLWRVSHSLAGWSASPQRLGEGNVPVFCSRETWKAWWEANPGGKVVKSEQSGGFVTEITFTGFLSKRDGPLKFWTVDSYNTQTLSVTRSEAPLPSKKRLRFSNR